MLRFGHWFLSGLSVLSCGNAVCAQSADTVPVLAAKPVRKTIVVTTTQPARIEAYQQAPLVARVAGYVAEVNVDIGDRVEQGQPLVVQQVPELADEVAQQQALLAQAEAQVVQARAAIAAARASAETAAAQVAGKQAAVTRTAAELARWTAELRRIEDLASSGSVTQKLVEEVRSQQAAAQAASDEATAHVDAAEAAAREQQALVAQAEADLGAAEARSKVAQANLQHAQTMRDYATIKAPFAGVITMRTVDVGHYVEPGERPLLTIEQLDRLRVSVDISESEAPLVNVGDPATIAVKSSTVAPLSGPIARTSEVLAESNRALRVEIDVANDNGQLRAGGYATATIELARSDNALVLPTTAIVTVEGRREVRVVVAGRIESKPVSTGLRSGAEIEIVEGITADDVVVTTRGENLVVGQSVQAVSPPGS